MKVNNIFSSIQGEGKYIGRPAVFVRVAGCVKPYCDFCDEKEAWDKGVEMTPEAMIAKVFVEGKRSMKYIVFTGGEPLCYFEEMLNAINWLSLRADIMIGWETSLKYVPESLRVRCGDSFVVSPKKREGVWNLDDGWEEVIEFDDVCWKFLIGERSDVYKVLELCQKKGIKRENVWLMPYGISREEVIENSELVIELCKRYGINFSTRLHILQWNRQKGV